MDTTPVPWLGCTLLLLSLRPPSASLSFCMWWIELLISTLLDLSYILHHRSLQLLVFPPALQGKICLVSLLRQKPVLFHTLSASRFDLSSSWEMRQNMQSRRPTRPCVAVDIKIQLLPSFFPLPHLPKAAGVGQACPITHHLPPPSYADGSSADLISQDGGETVS